MTLATPQPPIASPWLTIWSSPRETIQGIVAHRPTRHVLLLAALGAMAGIGGQVVGSGFATALLGWPVVAAIVVGGSLLGLLELYVGGAILQASGRLFGGRAGGREMRAVLAWSGVPNIAALLVCIAALVALVIGGIAAEPGTPAGIATEILFGIAGLWSFVLMVAMFGRVLGFGFWRAVLGAGLGWLLIWLVVLGCALAVRTVVIQPFSTPSGSMRPTLQIGDHVFVTKLGYGWFGGRLWPAEPARGDIVAFRSPTDGATELIQRIVGLPGDRIQMIGGFLHIDGQPVKRELLDDAAAGEAGSNERVRRWRETLPNGVTHETLDTEDGGPLDDTPVFTVPAGHYFMLGDNRDNATDSRMTRQVGVVPRDHLVGRAWIIYASFDDEETGTLRRERIGLSLR